MKDFFEPLFEGELAVFEGSSLPASKYDDEQFKQTATTADYFPRLQLMTASAEKCKSGEFKINHFALIVDQDYKDLGPQVDVAVLGWRPKAMDMNEDLIIVFDPKPDADGNPTGEYARIANKSFEKDSGCMFGHEYLIYIPEAKTFATCFLGTKTSRRESPAVKARMHKAATFKAGKIVTKSYTYYSMQCIACQQNLELPDIEKITEVVTKFNAEEGTSIELAEDGPSEERAR